MTLDEIRDFISTETGVSKVKLKGKTRIYEDLKIDGSDAFELLKSFEQKFKVDMTGFEYSSYFAPEGIDILGAFMRIFRKKRG